MSPASQRLLIEGTLSMTAFISLRRRFIRIALLVAAGALVGCAHPNIKVAPNYVPSRGIEATSPPAAEPVAIALNVTDQRSFKGTRRSDGKEIIAQGNKGKIILETPVDEFMRQSLTAAYQEAGFEVRDDAPVTLNVVIREVRVEAFPYTHWGLPSDRASSVDLVGVVLPGPNRPTRALAVVNVDVRKNDQAVGLSYYIEGYATRKSNPNNQSIVTEAISQSWSDAVNRIVAETAGGIPIVANQPVTAAEREQRDAEIADQRQELESAMARITEREQRLAADHTAIESVRQLVLDERNKVEIESLANQDQAKALEAQVADLNRRISLAREDEANQADAELIVAQLEAEQVEAAARKAELDQVAAEIAVRQTELDAQSQNLQAQLGEMNEQRLLLADRQTELAAQEQAIEARRGDLQEWNLALAEWKTRLAESETAIQRREAEFRQREQAIAASQAKVEAKQAELEKLEAERYAMSETVSPPKVTQSTNSKPIIYIARPDSLTPTTRDLILVSGHVFDDTEVVRTQFTLNGRVLDPSEQKGFAMSSGSAGEPASGTSRSIPGGGMRSGGSTSRGLVEFSFNAPLQPGQNRIRIEAWDSDGDSDFAEFVVDRRTDEGRIHLVTIGVNGYDMESRGVPPLRFAVADAKAVSEALVRNLGVNGQHIELYDDNATRSNIIRALQVSLPRNVSKQDTVIIFFSGHGAPAMVAAADGEENLIRFLLPYEAEADNLGGSAIPMEQIASFLSAIKSERLIFLADTCYSGGVAEGARTVGGGAAFKGFGMSVVEAVEKEAGTGRVIITASDDDEIAQENETLGHGVFTYHLIAGLNGAADADGNRLVTVRELYDFVSREVAKSTNGSQHPQINSDELRGDITVSRLN